jgi:hypothetical protein
MNPKLIPERGSIIIEAAMCPQCFQIYYQGYLLDEHELESELAKRGILAWNREVCLAKWREHQAICQGKN